jgi:predicted nuclease of predicted toxin-antitoxin system
MAEHVADLRLPSASDNEIRDSAAGGSAVVVTKDEDFAIRRMLSEGPAVVWLPVGNTRRIAEAIHLERGLRTRA